MRDKHPDNDLSIDELESYFWIKYPEADKQIYSAIFKQLNEIEIDPAVGLELIRELKLRKSALELSTIAYRVGSGTNSVEELASYYADNFVKVDHNITVDPLAEVTTDLEELIAQTYSEPGLRWRLDCLNKSLGSLRAGDFGFIFARPETGKTTFLASEISSMLSGSGNPIIWFNNEEQGRKVMFRIVQSFFGLTKDKLLSNPKLYRDRFLEATNGKFKFFEAGRIARDAVEKIIDKYNPSVVVYDQLTKIKGFKADRPDLELGAIFQWAREIAKNRHAAIGVSQADGSAEGVRYLTMDHVANAKTAVQAEADFILGIGYARNDAEPYLRHIHISKNKLTGDPDSMEELRHGKFDVMLEPQIARYRDIIKFN